MDGLNQQIILQIPQDRVALFFITVGGVLEVIEMILLLGVVDLLLNLLNKNFGFINETLPQITGRPLLPKEEGGTPRAWDKVSSS